MLRCSTFLRTLPPLAAVNAHTSINRIIGGRCEVFGSISTYTELMKGSKSEVVSAAARLGRAHGLIQRRAFAAALEDINEIIKNPVASAPDIGAHALALRLKVLNAMLDTAEDNLVVTGTGNINNIEEVTKLRGSIKEDLESMGKDRLECPLMKLVRGEYEMTLCHYDEAIKLIDKAISEFVSKVAALESEKVSEDPIKADSSNTASIIAYQMIHAKRADADLISAVKSEHSLSQDDEAVAVAAVLAAAATKHTYVDFFSLDDRYAMWPSPSAANVRKGLLRYSGTPADIEAAIKAYTPAKGAKDINVKSILGGAEPVVDTILSRAGASKDPALQSILDRITESNDCELNGAAMHKMNTELIGQLVARSKVSKAVCLITQMKEEGIKILDQVVTEDKYVHMWKALLARGRGNKKMGHIDAAEADLKMLFALKTPLATHDIPLRDEHRTKSVF